MCSCFFHSRFYFRLSARETTSRIESSKNRLASLHRKIVSPSFILHSLLLLFWRFRFHLFENWMCGSRSNWCTSIGVASHLKIVNKMPFYWPFRYKFHFNMIHTDPTIATTTTKTRGKIVKNHLTEWISRIFCACIFFYYCEGKKNWNWVKWR